MSLHSMVCFLKRACFSLICYNETIRLQKFKVVEIVLFNQVLAVGFGGAGGALLRYLVIVSTAHSFLPIGTLIINISGSFLLGMINSYFASKKQSLVFLALGSGFCGGFTTMSTFSQEIITLMRTSIILAAIYLGATLILGLFAGFLGLHLFGNRRGDSV